MCSVLRDKRRVRERCVALLISVVGKPQVWAPPCEPQVGQVPLGLVQNKPGQVVCNLGDRTWENLTPLRPQINTGCMASVWRGGGHGGSVISRMAGGEGLRSLIVSGIRRLTGRAGKERERIAILGSGQSQCSGPSHTHIHS